jgi:RNA polymerase sigma factor (sigma-70 family)
MAGQAIQEGGAGGRVGGASNSATAWADEAQGAVGAWTAEEHGGREDTADAGRSELLRLVADGDGTAWTVLVEEQRARLLALGRGYRLTHHETEDALQKTWLALLKHAGQIREPECLGAWLSTTMRRECLTLLRDRRVELVAEWDRHESRCAVVEDPLARLHALEEKEMAAQLWILVEKLPTRQRELLCTLYSDEKLSYAEVSVRTGLPIGAIGPTRQRALRRLRSLFDESHLPDAA